MILDKRVYCQIRATVCCAVIQYVTMIGHRELRQKYFDFFEKRGHVKIESSPLVLQNDATTLFTSSGMQPLVPYLLGQRHDLGKRLVDIQPCIRVNDIEEVGNNRHDTFFEMLGNWSLGDYFKEEQLSWCLEFLTKQIEIPIHKLHVTAFEGNKSVPKDTESVAIWEKLGISKDKIHYYGAEKNWWSRSGPPETMPTGEIGGPDSEVFFEFDDVRHDTSFGQVCHPNCDCGRFMEICNSVFIQYKKEKDGSLSQLPHKNVDFGGGLERLLAASNNDPDIFNTDAFSKIISHIEAMVSKKYTDPDYQSQMRIVADHIKSATMVINNGVIPSNKEQGYVLRRLLRRSIVKMRELSGTTRPDFSKVVESVIETYDGYCDIDKSNGSDKIMNVITEEVGRFASTLDRGVKIIEKMNSIDGKTAFDLYQSYGFPYELTKEIVENQGKKIDIEAYKVEFEKHKVLSKKTSTGMFKGGLADHSEEVVKYHTATHLIHQALKDVMGADIRQEGSNITGERLRFDFYSVRKPTEEDIKKIEEIVNKKIADKLPVYQFKLPKIEAEKLGASSFFKEKYGDIVSVYCIGGTKDSPQGAYSKEFCGGPHVPNTQEIVSIKIESIKKIGANILRLYGKKS